MPQGYGFAFMITRSVFRVDESSMPFRGRQMVSIWWVVTGSALLLCNCYLCMSCFMILCSYPKCTPIMEPLLEFASKILTYWLRL